MIGTHHTHTTWSDGKADVAALTASAHEQGVDVLGVSDHLTMFPSGRQPDYSMRIHEIAAYVQNVRDVSASSPITVLPGIEVDWFSGMEDQLGDMLGAHAFAYRIGSVHFVGEMCVDCHAGPWERLDQSQRDEVFRGYWKQVRAMARSGLFDVVGHIDLPKKFGFAPAIDMGEEISLALDAIAATGAIVELNTAGWHKPCRDAYPTVEILRACRARGIRTMISADAHQPRHLLRDFAQAASRLREAGYDEVAMWNGDGFGTQPIDDAVRGLAASEHAAPDGLDDF